MTPAYELKTLYLELSELAPKSYPRRHVAAQLSAVDRLERQGDEATIRYFLESIRLLVARKKAKISRFTSST